MSNKAGSANKQQQAAQNMQASAASSNNANKQQAAQKPQQNGSSVVNSSANNKQDQSANPTKTASSNQIQVNNNQDDSSNKIFKDLIGIDQNKSINRLIYGSTLNKSTRQGNGPWHPIYFYILENDLTILQWLSQKKPFNLTRINLKTVSAITEFPVKALGKNINRANKLLLAIQHSNGELVLSFENEQIKNEWWNGLQYFVALALNRMDRIQKNPAPKDTQITTVNVVVEKKITKDEISQSLQKMNIFLTKKHFTDLFNTLDQQKTGAIGQKAYLGLIKQLLFKEELLAVYQKYCADFKPEEYDKPLMKPIEFLNFFQNEQQQSLTAEQIAIMVNDSKIEGDSKSDNLSFLNFVNIIYGDTYNSIFNPDYMQLHQDMKRPLNAYYICSSYNIYALNNQLTGEASVYAYANGLKAGFRFIELEIWSGDDGEPIVNQGQDQQDKLQFQNVCDTIKTYGFQNNPFPIILSFDMHCDIKGQERVAQIIKEELGNLVYQLPIDFDKADSLPSPHSLKNKIIIKGRRDINGIASDDVEVNYDKFVSNTSTIRENYKNMIASDDKFDQNTGRSIVNQNSAVKYGSPAIQNRNTIEEEKSNGPLFYQKDYEKNSEVYFNQNKKQQDEMRNSFNNSTDRLSYANQYQTPDNKGDLTKSGQKVSLFTLNMPGSNTPQQGANPNVNNNNLISMRQSIMSDNNQNNGGLYQRNSVNNTSMYIDNPSNNRGILDERDKDYPNFVLEEDEDDQNYYHVNTLNGLKDPTNIKNENEKGRKTIQYMGVSVATKSASPKRLATIIEQKDSPMLTELYALINLKWNLNGQRYIWHVSSIPDNKLLEFYQNNPKEFVDYHRKYLSRVYPSNIKNLTNNSPNYNPLPSWNSGIQIVSLNCLASDETMYLNYAKFITNGACGYVLKPKFLQDTALNPNTNVNIYPDDLTQPKATITIKIISGKQLRITESQGNIVNSESPINPFVEIKLRGAEIDEIANAPFKTSTLQDNGFNPKWSTQAGGECKITYKICAPDLATIIFYVMNDNNVAGAGAGAALAGVGAEGINNANLIGWYAIELKNIKRGYRTIPLLNKAFQQIPNSYILCYIAIDGYSYDAKNN